MPASILSRASLSKALPTKNSTTPERVSSQGTTCPSTATHGNIPHSNHVRTATEDSGQAERKEMSSSWLEGGFQSNGMWKLECGTQLRKEVSGRRTHTATEKIHHSGAGHWKGSPGRVLRGEGSCELNCSGSQCNITWRPVSPGWKLFHLVTDGLDLVFINHLSPTLFLAATSICQLPTTQAFKSVLLVLSMCHFYGAAYLAEKQALTMNTGHHLFIRLGSTRVQIYNTDPYFSSHVTRSQPSFPSLIKLHSFFLRCR